MDLMGMAARAGCFFHQGDLVQTLLVHMRVDHDPQTTIDWKSVRFANKLKSSNTHD